jgi:hypothetical protein
MEIEISVCVSCGIPAQEHAGQDHAYQPGGKRWLETLPRAVNFRDRQVPPPAALYVTVDDSIEVTMATSVTGIEIDLGMRMQLANGEVIPMVYPFFPPNTRAATVKLQNLPEGFILSATLSTPTAGVRKGQCFANVSLVRGTVSAPQDLYGLIAGYVVTGNDIAWPWPDADISVDGVGLVKDAQITGTAAGADFTTTVPAGARWTLQSIQAQLTASVAGGNRVPHLVITDGAGNSVYNAPANGNIIASQVAQISAGPGVASMNFDNTYLIPLPSGMQLLQGWIIKSLTTGIQAADQWANIWLNVMEWLEL